MTDLRRDFSFDGMDMAQLLARREQLTAVAAKAGENTDIQILAELVAIHSTLRRRSGGPPKQARAKSLPTIEDL